MTPTRRVVLFGAAVLVAAQFAPMIAREVRVLWRDFGPGWCDRPFPTEVPNDASYLCLQFYHRPSVGPGIAVTVALLLLLALCWPAVKWCLHPVRELVPMIEKVGPQNLGHRLRPGAGDDELSRLGRAIDDMMDRVAVGYEAQRRFAADASHELRTPLAVQRVLVEVGMTGERTGEQLALLADQLLAANVRNELLIEGLLVLAESDRGLVSRTSLRLDTLVGDILAANQERAADAGLTITGSLRPRVVLGEQVLLERLVTNLVQNAIKYNRVGGTIDVQVGGEPALTVTNTGDDITPESIPGLFEPFRRLSGSRLEHSGGAGLGLTIARSIVRAHDGTIDADPHGHDGLRVRVSFPG